MPNFLSRLFLPSKQKTNTVISAARKSNRWPMFDRLDRWFETMPDNTKRKYEGVLREFLMVMQLERNHNGASLFIRTTADDVNQYMRHCQTQPAQRGRSSRVGKTVSMGTIRHKIIILYTIFKELHSQKVIDDNPCIPALARVKKHKGNDRRPHRALPFEKVDEIFKLDLPVLEKAKWAALFGGALRASELSEIRVGDVVTGNNDMLSILLRNTKRQRAERQLILEWAKPYIRDGIAQRRSEGASDDCFLFPAYRAGIALDRPESYPTLLRDFKKLMVRIRLSHDYSCHDARKTTITKLHKEGMPLDILQRFSRHSTAQMTLHYIQEDADEYEDKIQSAWK